MKEWLWRTMLRQAALRHGFLDPFTLLARLHRFAQPSEVAEPIELLRAGVELHARGLINSRVIQHNLDWAWPYWISRQFDPRDVAFVPRAFSLTHINLTHRNWTAVGLPDLTELPIVDPRGLVTPFLDGWSVDGWIVDAEGARLLPAQARDAEQRLLLDDGTTVATTTRADGLTLQAQADAVVRAPEEVVVRMRYTGFAQRGGWLVIALRPCNPEGISFIHRIALDPDRRGWNIEETARAVEFSAAADYHQVSHYEHGDVAKRLPGGGEETSVNCEVGMATAAACFALEAGRNRTVEIHVPLRKAATQRGSAPRAWAPALLGTCALQIPDQRMQFLFDAAVRTLILLSPGDVFPGPYTYRRFWFRDAAYMINALLVLGLAERVRPVLERFPGRQTVRGYFHSQDGEWDSNGEALWTLARFCELTGESPPAAWRKIVHSGARWIMNKRLDAADAPHAGLLPAGFSAEHFGPNDYYYWDDFWGVAGLNAASHLASAYGDKDVAMQFQLDAAGFMHAIERNLARAELRIGRRAMPASPYRRLDAGAVGCLVAGYPLQLLAADDPRLLDTAEFLIQNCLVDGAFFQDIIHSGINIYLTLHMAQVLLRAGDRRYFDLMSAVANLASPTGQWPEAIHPATRGGCMGDGQHGWAAAEWVLMVRHCFLREEGERLVLAAGVPAAWLSAGTPLRFGPTPTCFGSVDLEIRSTAARVTIAWNAQWRRPPDAIEIRLPGYSPVVAKPEQGRVELSMEERP